MTTSLHETHPQRSTSAPALVRLRDDLRTRREARAERRRLTRELATYTTDVEIDDLLAAVDRSEGGDAEVVRTLLLLNREQGPRAFAS